MQALQARMQALQQMQIEALQGMLAQMQQLQMQADRSAEVKPQGKEADRRAELKPEGQGGRPQSRGLTRARRSSIISGGRRAAGAARMIGTRRAILKRMARATTERWGTRRRGTGMCHHSLPVHL